jgi:hypothetical protein
MIERCANPLHASYYDYAGRGIWICEEWLNFEAFLADMGDVPMGPR